MKTLDDIGKGELIDLLNRCWMTHDGTWFYSCFQECGIEAANRMNKSAIRLLAPLETARLKKAAGFEKERIETFDELKELFELCRQLVIPDFMNGRMTFQEENVMHWEFAPKNCFAYKGIKRIGAIEGYECGVIYRLMCWMDSFGLKYTVEPEIDRCLMLTGDRCEGDFRYDF
ncbi:MAG: hypothetical protein JW950_08770 [Deltaproteobacteria bacterium]|nr:hypothetical protein [Deltaproteobacteria bacterium]